MRHADGARDLAQRPAETVKPERIALQVGPLLGSPTRSLGRFALSELPPRWRLRAPGFREKTCRPLSSVIVRPHMAAAAQRDEVLGRVIAGEPERLDVMDVERASVLLGCLAAVAAHAIAVSNGPFGGLPAGAIAKGRSSPPHAVACAGQMPCVERRGRARASAILSMRPLVGRDEHLCPTARACERNPSKDPARAIVTAFATPTTLGELEGLRTQLATHESNLGRASDSPMESERGSRVLSRDGEASRFSRFSAGDRT
jgi:hypothetical protein